MALHASVKRQIARNTLTGWGYKALKIGLSIFTNPLLIAGLGKEGYALITLLATLIGFSELTDLGVRPALGRELAEARSHGRQHEVNALTSSALAVYACLFALLAAGLLVATPVLARLMAGADAPLTEEAVWLIRTYGVFALAVAFARPVYSAVLAAANRFDLRNQAESLFTLVQGFGVIGVLAFTDWGLLGWVAVSAAAQAFNLGQIIYYAHKAEPGLRLRPSLVQKSEIKRLYSLGSLLFISQWAKKIKFDADPLVIARFLNPAQVALYKPANSLMANIRPLLTTFAGQLYPVTTKLFAEGDTARVQTLFLAASRYTLLMAIPVAVFFGFYGEEVMRLWLGSVLSPEDIRTAGHVLSGWALIELGVAFEGSAWSVLFGMRRVRFVIWGEVVAALVNVAASIWLVQVTDWGVMAVVIPSVVLEALFRPFYALYAARAAGISPLRLFAEVYARPLQIGILLSLVAIWAYYWAPPVGWLPLTLHGGLIGILFLLLAYLLGLKKTEKDSVTRLVRKLLRLQ